MSKAKKNPWDATFRRIRGVHRADWLCQPRPTAADLDEVEEELGFTFPLSYRAFAEQFGLGGELHVLPRVLSLTHPPGAKKRDWSRSVVGATQFHRTYRWEDERWGTAPIPFLKRVVVFAMDPGYHTFVFDPLEVTHIRLRECRIYDISRQNDATAIATSFDGWLEWIDDRYRFDDEEEEEEQEEQAGAAPRYPLVFKPDSSDPGPMPYHHPGFLRGKRGVGKRNVKLWLARNDGAVGTLAGVIREQGQADAFPILADALEEAGCTHADLLRACRHGDPEIDGAWVLHVLLGDS